jgi:GGDEF domain-containing protein
MSLDDLCSGALDRYFDVGFNRLMPDEQLLVVIWGIEADVNNGGFHQYYFNGYGNFARLAPRMLRQIGASQTAQIVAEANALFGPEGPAPDRDERQRALESLDDDSWEYLDNRFWAYPDNLSELLGRHVGLQSIGRLCGLPHLIAPMRGPEYPVNASLGLAMTTQSMSDATAWLESADKACYQAKKAGRGQLICA